MPFVWSRHKVLLAAAFIMMAILARNTWMHAGDVVAADLPNPDSYYKLVLLRDHADATGFHFVARDNAPAGNWVHWSLPHSWSMWQVHRGLVALGMSPPQALLWAGAGMTQLGMILLVILTALAVSRAGTLRAAVVAALALATSVPLLSYGGVSQLTHHVFMLLPGALAAACLLTSGRVTARADVLAGVALGLSLWISPETMPLIATLAAVRAARALQQPVCAGSWRLVAGFWTMLLTAWLVDPPPPTFSAWALDHISLAWLLFGAGLGGLLLLAGALARAGMRWQRALPLLALVAAAAAGLWLLVVPGALAGPLGLMPDELRPLFWAVIDELQPLRGVADAVDYLLMPVAAALLLTLRAWRAGSLWMLTLAMATLAYGVLAAMHLRMGAASSLVTALAFGTAISHFRAFSDDRAEPPLADQLAGVMLVLLAVTPVVISSLAITGSRGGGSTVAAAAAPVNCALADVAPALHRLPPATILIPVFSGPELLYRTPHRVIAGPYHHNIDGIRDNYRAWLDTQGDEALHIMRRRDIRYVLGCRRMQVQLLNRTGPPTLARRVAQGNVPAWLEPVAWPLGVKSDWRLYRVLPAPEAGRQ